VEYRSRGDPTAFGKEKRPRKEDDEVLLSARNHGLRL
jgi:hypothetical protein